MCIYAEFDLCAYLHLFFKFIVSSHHQHSAHFFLLTFIKQSEAIKFVSDWKQKGQEPGGRTFKKAFARSLYFAHTRHMPPSNDDPSEDRKNFKTFKAQQHFKVLLTWISKIYSSSSACQSSWIPLGTSINSNITPRPFRQCSRGFAIQRHLA